MIKSLNITRKFTIYFLLGVGILLSNNAIATEAKILLELFTSQGCYSCPPAEKLLETKYINHPEVLALEMHVDYWDDLVYRGSVWQDPYSSSKFTQRQVYYTRGLFTTTFTPQMIVQGKYNMSGTNEGKIDLAISNVKENLNKHLVNIKPSITKNNNQYEFSLNTSNLNEDIVVHSVVYLKQVSTQVTAGENKDKLLINNNVVTEFTTHQSSNNNFNITLSLADENEFACAVIIQEAPQDEIIGVWPCS